MDYKRYKLFWGQQITGTDTFTSFSVPGSRDKWRHLWLQGSGTSYRLVLSAKKHVKFVVAAQRGEQTASPKEKEKLGVLHAENCSYFQTWRKIRKSPGGKKRVKNTHLVNKVKGEKANKQAGNLKSPGMTYR